MWCFFFPAVDMHDIMHEILEGLPVSVLVLTARQNVMRYAVSIDLWLRLC